MSTLLRTASLFTLAFALSACGSSAPTAYVGPVSQTGTLVSTGVSLIRRGTHVLKVDGKSIYYLESKKENLEAFNNQRVFLQGVSEANTYAQYLPVVVISTIKALDSSVGMHTWKVPALNISIVTPDDWVGSIDNNTVTFRTKQSNQPLLSIMQKNDTTLPSGKPVRLAGRAGSKIDRDNNAQDIYLPDGNRILSLHFTPSNAATPALLQAYTTTLSTLVFLTSSSSSSINPATGSGAGIPCGGPAGVLCPSGYYCDIQDTKLNIGKCMR